jgi:hypothetical protein
MLGWGSAGTSKCDDGWEGMRKAFRSFVLAALDRTWGTDSLQMVLFRSSRLRMSLPPEQTQRFLAYLRSSIELNKEMLKSYRDAPMRGYHGFGHMEKYCEHRMQTFQDVLEKVQSLIEVPQEEEK